MLVLHRGLRVGVPQHSHERGEVSRPFKNIRRERMPAAAEFRRRTESHILRAFRHWFATLVRCALS
jgi:hypothetical protein